MFQELEQRMLAEEESGTHILYYYSLTGEDVKGPVQEWQLFNLWQAGEIKTDILVCEDGSKAWRPWLTKPGEAGIGYFPPPSSITTDAADFKRGKTVISLFLYSIAAILLFFAIKYTLEFWDIILGHKR
ncbi:MAG: GYF domain-containing protein [Verrucomicrobiota bacterium]